MYHTLEYTDAHLFLLLCILMADLHGYYHMLDLVRSHKLTIKPTDRLLYKAIYNVTTAVC